MVPVARAKRKTVEDRTARKARTGQPGQPGQPGGISSSSSFYSRQRSSSSLFLSISPIVITLLFPISIHTHTHTEQHAPPSSPHSSPSQGLQRLQWALRSTCHSCQLQFPIRSLFHFSFRSIPLSSPRCPIGRAMVKTYTDSFRGKHQHRSSFLYVQ